MNIFLIFKNSFHPVIRIQFSPDQRICGKTGLRSTRNLRLLLLYKQASLRCTLTNWNVTGLFTKLFKSANHWNKPKQFHICHARTLKDLDAKGLKGKFQQKPNSTAEPSMQVIIFIQIESCQYCNPESKNMLRDESWIFFFSRFTY